MPQSSKETYRRGTYSGGCGVWWTAYRAAAHGIVCDRIRLPLRPACALDEMNNGGRQNAVSAIVHFNGLSVFAAKYSDGQMPHFCFDLEYFHTFIILSASVLVERSDCIRIVCKW